ncbi:MAG: YnfA family protein [Chloroflexi bacterium]|nr:YnfA family protein [Chloroflexota bacterium]
MFFTAAIFEIGGAYSIWQWRNGGKPAWFVLMGAVALLAYSLIQTVQTFSFGRVFAAYGGIFIMTAMLWGWWVDKHVPDRGDWLGTAIALIGAAVILWWPRGA